jgi:tetratricopeptide (TPR) repeat protein
VHRDIKPENVMVRRDGYVKVLDFGLAKLTEPSLPAPDTRASTATGISTRSGMVMGTPRYMSPEQARGEKVDARSDIFSLGSVFYEMVTGRAPFPGVTRNDSIAAVLKDEPPPVAGYVPDAPRELGRIVGKALRKDREGRYQTVKDLLNDLKDLKQELMLADRAEHRESKPQASSFSIRNLQSPIRILTVLAVLVTAATAAWFYFHRPPVLTSKDTILLADFENKTVNKIFDGTLKQGLAMQLEQSPFLNLFPEARAQHTLRLMGRSPGERVTAELAREICQRENLKAFIAGSIVSLGSHYVITLEAINGQGGESLARQQIEAESSERVLRSLSEAATRLREKLGESLSSIQRFDKAFEEATTSKLEAFKFYSQGAQLAISGSAMDAIPLLKRAVEIDPDFAYAYSLLSATFGATGRPGLAAEYAEKAYALRERVNEYEKLRIANWYHRNATGNVNKQIEVLMLQERMYPRKWAGGPADLAVSYNQIGRYDQAIAASREAIRLNPNFFAPRFKLAQALLRLNRFAEAKEAIEQALRLELERTSLHTVLYQIAFIHGDTAGAQQQIDWARGRPDEYEALDWQTGVAAFAGQWRSAQELSRRAIDLAARGDMKEVAAQYAAEQALRSAVFGDCQRVTADAAQGLSLERSRASLPRAALALGLCGDTNEVKSITDELVRRYPEDTVINSIWLPAIRAAEELQRGNAAQAIEQLHSTSRYETAAEFWPQYLRGQAFLKVGRGAEAATEFQKILDHRGEAPLSVLYPLAHLGRARAAALSSDVAKSRQAYQTFFSLWKDADSEDNRLNPTHGGRTQAIYAHLVQIAHPFPLLQKKRGWEHSAACTL